MRRIEVVAVVAVLSMLSLAFAITRAIQPAAQPDPLQALSSRLPPSLQRQLQAREQAVRAMTPAQRQALRQRVAAWDALPLEERGRRRERWQAWLALAPGERRQLRAAAQRFAGLPGDQQQALRARFAQLDGSDRRGWLLGPVLGADYAGLRPLLMQVPAKEREPLLAVLRAMAPDERLDLVTLAQRTPPQQREALRRELLSTSAADRAAWLQSRLRR